MSYRIIEHTADIAALVEGDSIEEFFTSAFNFWKTQMVGNMSDSKFAQTKIMLNASSLPELLNDFLNEINYLAIVKDLIIVAIEKIVIKAEEGYKLYVDARGADNSAKTIELNYEIKSATFHQFNLDENKGRYKSLIVFDI